MHHRIDQFLSIHHTVEVHACFECLQGFQDILSYRILSIRRIAVNGHAVTDFIGNTAGYIRLAAGKLYGINVIFKLFELFRIQTFQFFLLLILVFGYFNRQGGVAFGDGYGGDDFACLIGCILVIKKCRSFVKNQRMPVLETFTHFRIPAHRAGCYLVGKSIHFLAEQVEDKFKGVDGRGHDMRPEFPFRSFAWIFFSRKCRHLFLYAFYYFFLD